MNKKTFGSLFAGVGGFDIGMENAGWDCSWQVEWDKHCQSVLQKHWSHVPKYWDIQDVNGAELKPVDCIVFGSPCQDLSVAGKGGGLEGSRSGLFYEAIRVIKEMRNATGNEFPKWSIWENVPGALTSNKGNDFAKVLDEMANIGALVLEWHILDAQWFGVAQRRRRIFLLACYDSGTASKCPEQILPVPKDSEGNIKKGRKERKHSARAAKTNINQPILYGQSGFAKWTEGGVTLAATDYKRPERNVVCEPISFHLKQDPVHSYNVSQCLYGQNGVGVAVDVLAYDGYNNAISENIYRTLRIGIDSADHIAIPIQGTIIGRSDKAGPQGKGFGDENDPSYTLDTISQHGVMTPDLLLRRLTPLECERLMGFPDSEKNVIIEPCLGNQENLVFVESQNLKSQKHVLDVEKIGFIKNVKFVENNLNAKEVKILKPVEVSVKINLGARHIAITRKQKNKQSTVETVILNLEFLQANLNKNFAQLLVHMHTALEKNPQIGKEESPLRKINLASLKSGSVYPILYGEETTGYVKSVLSEIEQMIENSMFTTYYLSLNPQKKDLILRILSSYVINAITGSTHLLTETEYLSKINLLLLHGHTQYYHDGKVIADTNRYKMCGNAVASPVAEWIGRKIYEI